MPGWGKTERRWGGSHHPTCCRVLANPLGGMLWSPESLHVLRCSRSGGERNRSLLRQL